MTVKEEIDAICLRALKTLDDAHDYFTYTKRAWRALRLAVQLKGVKFSFHNPSTHSRLNELEFLSRTQRYAGRELAYDTLQQFVSIFENFLFDVLRTWLLAYPKSLSSRQLSGKDILGLPDKAAIVDALVDKELKDVFYDRPANWFEYLRGRVGMDAPSDSDAAQFAEIKATRDILVHGQGIANAYYIDKARSSARAQLGKRLDVPGPYHQASWALIRKLIREIGTAMAAKAQ